MARATSPWSCKGFCARRPPRAGRLCSRVPASRSTSKRPGRPGKLRNEARARIGTFPRWARYRLANSAQAANRANREARIAVRGTPASQSETRLKFSATHCRHMLQVRLRFAAIPRPPQAERPHSLHTGVTLAVSFSRHRRCLASAGADQTVRLWDARAGEPPALAPDTLAQVQPADRAGPTAALNAPSSPARAARGRASHPCARRGRPRASR